MDVSREKIGMRFTERIFGVLCLSTAVGLLSYWITYIFFLLLRATRLNNPGVIWVSSGIVGSACCALLYLGYSELAYPREPTQPREQDLPRASQPQRKLVLKRDRYGRAVSINYRETAGTSELQTQENPSDKMVGLIKRLPRRRTFLTASVLLFLILGAYSATATLGYSYRDLLSGASPFVVIATDSMSPQLKQGDFTIFIKTTPESIQEGDIVAIKVPSPYDKVCTSSIVHRVIEKWTEEGVTYFRTKGDANPNPDLWTLSTQDLIGKCVTAIPYLGLPLLFIKTPLGFTLLASTIIAYFSYTLTKSKVGKIG